MAFYEMLPGAGMPPGLQAGMDSVLNKKFGTSTTYPAEDWPDTVNLMGPLPEKTASGAIVTFSDGADAVPIKSWQVTLPASLSGYSSVECMKAGKNLVDGTDFTQGLPSTTIGASIDTISASTRYAYFGTAIKSGNYNVSSVSTDSDYYNAILIFGYSNGLLAVYTGGTVNGNKTVDLSACDYVRVAIGARNNTFVIPTDFTDYGTIQLEVGSTATSYEPYTAPTTATASLGRTIYGGTADVVKGQGKTKVHKQTYTGDTLSSVSLSYGQAAEGYTHLYFNIVDIPLAYNPTADNVISNIGVPWNNNASAAGIPSVGECFRLINGGSPQKPIIYWYTNQTWANVDAFKTWLNANPITVVYEVADEETFTFTPITPTPETALGVNNFWSDSGDSEVTYRADINLALGGN